MLDAELLTVKSMRKLTCAVVIKARSDIMHGKEYKIREVLRFVNDGGNYWWECIDQFCGLNSDKIRNILKAEAKKKLKIIKQKHARRIAKIEINRTPPLLVFRDLGNTQILCRENRNRNITNIHIGRIGNLDSDRPDINSIGVVQRQTGKNNKKVDKLTCSHSHQLKMQF